MQTFINQLGELTGTMILILIGNGVCFSVSHSKMFANQPGKWIVVALAWGIAVFMGVTVALAIGTPGHLNPAVSVYAAITEGVKVDPFLFKYLGYIPFQVLGAMIGQSILNFINWKFIIATAAEDPGATRGAHCTNPAFDNKADKATVRNFSYELVGTFALIILVDSFGRIPSFPNLGPIGVMLVVMGIGMALGSATGYAINPARDLGPRIVYAIMRPFIMRKAGVEIEKANWSYAWVPVVAPLLGGLLMGGFGLINSPLQPKPATEIAADVKNFFQLPAYQLAF